MKVSLWAEIRRLYEVEKLSRRAIARRLHCCRRTVDKALTMQEPPRQTSQPRGSILDPYRPQIDALIAKHPEMSAVRVLEEISQGDEGYGGRVTLVRDYLRQIRPARGRVYQEVHYESGEAMQVDWGDCGDCGSAKRRDASRSSSPPCASAACVTSNSAWLSGRPTSTGRWCTPWTSTAAVPARLSSTI